MTEIHTKLKDTKLKDMNFLKSVCESIESSDDYLDKVIDNDTEYLEPSLHEIGMACLDMGLVEEAERPLRLLKQYRSDGVDSSELEIRWLKAIIDQKDKSIKELELTRIDLQNWIIKLKGRR